MMWSCIFLVVHCTVTVMLFAEDDPAARLEWSKLHEELSSDIRVDDGTLIIPYVSAAHQGTYRCTTTTVLGTSYMQFILTVEGSYSWLYLSAGA